MDKLIEIYYRKGLYTDAQLDIFIRAGYITAEKAEKLKEGSV